MNTQKYIRRYLKSNMDRFIVNTIVIIYAVGTDLKSNMDRFIGNTLIKLLEAYQI